jgi:site-specific DNA-methyltransferase (adenine-specific)
MCGERADLWLTDPPYNVAVKNSKGMKIANDDMSNSEFYKFLHGAFTAAKDVLQDGAPFYVWFATREHINFESALASAGLSVKQELIWNKNSFTLGRSHYQWKHEPCLYGWAGEKCRYFIGSRNLATVLSEYDREDLSSLGEDELRNLLLRIYSQDIPTSVIDEPKPAKDSEHPTMKPVRLFGRQIVNSSKQGDIVLDTFGGSGTTIVACEQLGRKARLMELDPHYCDVIIARWEKLTGAEAFRL